MNSTGHTSLTIETESGAALGVRARPSRDNFMPSANARSRKSASPPAGVDAGRMVKNKTVNMLIEALRQEIVTGRLPKGEKIPNERILAEQFGVSQPTVRAAVRALETLGLIEARQGSGSYVSAHADYALASAMQNLLQLGQVDILEVLSVRRGLGLQSVSLAAERAEADDVQAIEIAWQELQAMPEVTDLEELIARIVGFQRAVSAASGSPLLFSLEIFLATLLIETQIKAFRQRGLRYWKNRSLSFQPDRQAIVDSIRDGSPEAAMASMDNYLQHQRVTFEAEQATRLSDPRLIAVAAAILPQFKD